MSNDTKVSAELQAKRVYKRFSPHNPPEHKTLGEPAPDFVCDKCSAVDWAQLPRLADNCARDVPVWTMVLASLDHSSAELSASPCKVCRLLSYVKLPRYDGHHCALYAYSGLWTYTQLRVISEELHGSSKKKLDSLSYEEEFPSLTVIGPGDHKDLTSMKTQPDHVNPIHYDALANIMRDCLRNHKKTCKNPYLSKVTDIPGLQVIDSEARKVVKAPPQCQYLALSYVWGKVKHSDDLNNSPPVIADTFTVCARLGLKYMWIDQYASIPSASTAAALPLSRRS